MRALASYRSPVWRSSRTQAPASDCSSPATETSVTHEDGPTCFSFNGSRATGMALAGIKVCGVLCRDFGRPHYLEMASAKQSDSTSTGTRSIVSASRPAPMSGATMSACRPRSLAWELIMGDPDSYGIVEGMQSVSPRPCKAMSKAAPWHCCTKPARDSHCASSGVAERHVKSIAEPLPYPELVRRQRVAV